MRSHDSWRSTLEWGLRGASLALIAWMLWISLAARDPAGGWRASGSLGLADSLAAWTLDPRAESLHVALDAAPSISERAWLAALRRGGSGSGEAGGTDANVTWSASGLTPLALTAEPYNEPAGGISASIAAMPGSRVVISDELGVLDTIAMDGTSARLRARAVEGVVSASTGGYPASAGLRDTLAPREVAVLGSAGWESKFVVAALEESGWEVSARLAVAPGVDVRQGKVRLDTATTSVVVALDSTAARDARAIERFVRGGGGLVLAGDAARSAGFARVAPGRVGARVRAAAISFADSAPRRALGFYPVETAVPDAIPLEERDGVLLAAARRVGAGRVVQVGYDETWRWRLQGGGNSPEAHRAWWSAVVGSAGYRAAHSLEVERFSLDPAPLAATFAALGNPSAARLPEPAASSTPGLRRWMLFLLLAMLLMEWASRRLRGVP